MKTDNWFFNHANGNDLELLNAAEGVLSNGLDNSALDTGTTVRVDLSFYLRLKEAVRKAKSKTIPPVKT